MVSACYSDDSFLSIHPNESDEINIYNIWTQYGVNHAHHRASFEEGRKENGWCVQL